MMRRFVWRSAYRRTLPNSVLIEGSAIGESHMLELSSEMGIVSCSVVHPWMEQVKEIFSQFLKPYCSLVTSSFCCFSVPFYGLSSILGKSTISVFIGASKALHFFPTSHLCCFLVPFHGLSSILGKSKISVYIGVSKAVHSGLISRLCRFLIPFHGFVRILC